MGSMSASDAAPLPRLGEVYFDVRGESRSMRLSWYADTGVAVFSIWQGGTCTGTFRLPIADLPRMVDALQRGPHGDARGDAGDPRDARGTAERRGRADQRAPGGYEDEPTGVYRGDVAGHAYQDDPGAHYRDADYPGDPLTGRYSVADPRPARYSEDPLTGAYRRTRTRWTTRPGQATRMALLPILRALRATPKRPRATPKTRLATPKRPRGTRKTPRGTRRRPGMTVIPRRALT